MEWLTQVCEDCKTDMSKVPYGVYHNNAGYYIGRYCKCGPWDRVSNYYGQREFAEKLLNPMKGATK